MVRSNAKLHLCSDAGDKTHCLHGNCNTLDGCSSFESLDSLYPQVSAKHRWRLHCCLCYQGIIYDVISLCLSLYNHTTETSNCLCKFCSPWPLIWAWQKILYFISLKITVVMYWKVWSSGTWIKKNFSHSCNTFGTWLAIKCYFSNHGLHSKKKVRKIRRFCLTKSRPQ